MTLNDSEVHKLLRTGAEIALTEWYPGQYNLQEQALEDLIHELWVWYLERPSARQKLAESDYQLSRRLVVRTALQTLAGEALQSDTFNGKTLFSSESVKDALKGRSTNKYLRAILPIAMAAVQKKDDETPGRVYAEAIRSRYEDNQVPPQGTKHVRLVRAIQALTNEVNVNYLTTDPEGAGSSSAVFPDVRRRSGGHSDPTGDTAVMLLENPALQEDYLEDTTWDQVMCGAAAEPMYTLPTGQRIRPTGWDAEMLLKIPSLTDLYLKLWQERAEREE